MSTNPNVQDDDQNLNGGADGADDQNSRGNTGGNSTAGADSWFNEATQFFNGKQTKILPDDELAREMWNSVKGSQKLSQDLNTYKSQVDELSVFKDDLAWLLSDAQIAELVENKLKGGNQSAGNNRGNNSSENDQTNALNETVSMLTENMISQNFNNHIGQLSKQYPDADIEEVKEFAKASGAIYRPDAPQVISEMVKKNAEKYQNLRKKFSSEAIENLKKNKGGIQSGSAVNTKGKTGSFRDGFEEAWKDFG